MQITDARILDQMAAAAGGSTAVQAKLMASPQLYYHWRKAGIGSKRVRDQVAKLAKRLKIELPEDWVRSPKVPMNVGNERVSKGGTANKPNREDCNREEKRQTRRVTRRSTQD